MKTLVISPHPDDETLGVGGTILSRIKKKQKVAWLIVTKLENKNTNINLIKKKKQEIEKVKKAYKFYETFQLDFHAAKLDQIPLGQLIDTISKVITKFKPNEVFLPHISDAHTDHQKIFSAISACTKTFRYPYINKLLCYETISETGYGIVSKKKRTSFNPNYYVNIDNFIKKKIKIAKYYKTEIKKHPFPRSIKNLRSLAILRGAESNNKFAEAFELLKFIEN
jgi:LmbE family N-acetylglucosaminyl deacetylase